MDSLENDIRALISKVTKIPEDKISPEANLFFDLSVDSLLGVEIFAALDKKYGIDLPEERLRKIATLNDIVKEVRNILEKRQNG